MTDSTYSAYTHAGLVHIEYGYTGKAEAIATITSQHARDFAASLMAAAEAADESDTTTRSYAVPDDAGSLMLAFSILDAQGYLTQFQLSSWTPDKNDPQPHPEEGPIEWHLMVTGYPKLHSDLLGSFEWLGY